MSRLWGFGRMRRWRPPQQSVGWPPGHFYSPVPDVQDLEARADSIWGATQLQTPGIDYNDASHAAILTGAFPRFMPEYTYPDERPPDDRLDGFYSRNSMFSWLDSRALFVLLREWRPARIIEVGSGYSSLLMADVNTRFLGGAAELTCIEPFPRPLLLKKIPSLTRLIRSRVQDVPASIFDTLQAGDILFIDSSHVSKIGSDVNVLLLTVLPRLRPGVRVHVHDIFLPEDYPREWVLQLGFHWNEQYLLQALLTRHGDVFRVLFGSYYAHLRFPQVVAAAVGRPPGHGYGGSSFWFEVAS